jgi:Lon protease-like protein
MHPRLIPLFPLQVVVFPRTRLPLHIFEDRYKEMVGDAIRDESEFGVVLAKEDGIVNAGCSVTVEKVMEMYSDGRMDILCLGKRRFEIVSLNEEKSFLQGEVSFFDDEDFSPTAELGTGSAPHQVPRAPAAWWQRSRPGGHPVEFLNSWRRADLDFLSRLLRHRSETRLHRGVNRYLRVRAAAAHH